MKSFLLILSFIVVIHSSPVSHDEPVLRSLVEPFMKCQNSDYYTCGKEQALKVVERLRTLRKLKLFNGVTIINDSPREARSLEPLPEEPLERSAQVSARLWQSTSDIFQNGELELIYPADGEEGRSMDEVTEEGRGKKKKQIKKALKLLIPLVILAKAKAVALTVLAFLVMAASLFKLATIAKIAFIIKIIGFIKALLAKKHLAQEQAWEVPHSWEPHVEYPHAEQAQGWEGGWSRSKNEANNLAYSAYSN